MTDGARALRQVRLSGRAARYVALLRDFGHLSDDEVDQLLVSIADAEGRAQPSLVDTAGVRAHAAAMLFYRALAAEGDSTLDQDWDLLFS